MNAPKRAARPGKTYSGSTCYSGKAKKVSSGPTVPVLNQFGDTVNRKKMGDVGKVRKTWGA